MAWTIELAASAARQLRQLDDQTARRILTFLRDRIAPLENPRSIGEPLRGKELGDFWKYRIGDWRLIADIEDQKLLITIIRLGHRREIYRRRD